MLNNYLAAALRNLARNKLYAALNISGLAVGLCCALLVGLIVRNELSYDHFLSGYERIYLAATMLAPAGRAPDYQPWTHNRIADTLKLKFREIEAITRLASEDIVMRRGDVQASEKIYWADRNAFDVLPLPVLSGNLKVALQRPDGLVLTQGIARKYFGDDDPVGQSLELGDHTAVVTAVIEDLPAHGTQLETGIFASGLAAYSKLTKEDSDPMNSVGSPGFFISVRTYFRLTPGASIADLQDAMPAFMDSFWPRTDQPGLRASLELLRLDAVHFFPGLNPGINNRVAIALVVGALILFVACINFVNLLTARAARRAVEVGLRKATGADRGALVLQFIGESLVYVVLATCFAVALTEWALPHVNAFLGTGAAFAYWRSPELFAWIAVSVIMLGTIAGIYPAFVLSAFSPAEVLKAAAIRPTGAASRQVLVTLQFAVLIALVIAAGVIHQQRQFATRDALRVNTDQVLIIRSPCRAAFVAELAFLSGVRSVACSSLALMNDATFMNVGLKNGGALAVNLTSTDFDVFALYGLKPLAGQWSLFTGARAGAEGHPRYVINASAVTGLGFSTPEAAIGQSLMLPPGPGAAPVEGEIIGVVPDFSLSSVEQAIKPTLYHQWPTAYRIINVKLDGEHPVDTLAAIDRLWTATGGDAPLDRVFLKDHIQDLYFPVLRQAQAFGIFSCLAILLACFGLIGMAASLVERRTKEIGIRKAMGASTSEVMRLLVWQFTKPVLWANLIAWPIAALVMNRWLQGFAYHSDLNLWLFLAATGIALIIALLTVSAHCYLVAREPPVRALRYE